MADLLPRAWLDGSIVSVDEARISPLDRGFLFGDAVYEAMPVCGGRIVGEDEHLERLDHSLSAIGIPNPRDAAGWRTLFGDVIDANGGGDMFLYLQVSRGTTAGRDHRFPEQPRPTVFAMAMEWRRPREDDYDVGVATALRPDERWARCDIKANSLLANVLARQSAAEAGAAEAILHRDGWITEGAASTVLLVVDGTLIAPPPDASILPGVTLRLALQAAAQEGIPAIHRRFSVAELRDADEVMMLASSRELVPVGRVDHQQIGHGKPGPVWRRLFRAYQRAFPQGTIDT